MAVKKELIVKPESFNLYSIGYEGGGQVPAELSARYNRRSVALEAIAAYQAKKGGQNGSKATSKS